MTKTNGSYRTAVPVTAEPYPAAIRSELAVIARAGGTVQRVEDLGDQLYRIHYVIPEQHSQVVDAGLWAEEVSA